MYPENCVITLTYDDDNVTTSLEYDDFQRFMKNFRRVICGSMQINPETGRKKWFSNGRKVRFLMCGEYGTEFGRPHFHVCLFGYGFYEDRTPAAKSRNGSDQYMSKTLDKLWGKGRATIGEFSYSSAMYIAKYCTKIVRGDLAEKHYETFDIHTGEICQRIPEFGKFSLKPGIGIPWLHKYWSDITNTNTLVVNGRRMKIPRLYKIWLEENKPEEFKDLKRFLLAKSEKNKENSTVDRLIVREHLAEIRLKEKEGILK